MKEKRWKMEDEMIEYERLSMEGGMGRNDTGT